ncbi:aldolase [Candidatus Atribacteria bacterium HGW-Atribacteria-1]|nr:MAG: aldolase [Candidatus Atribacteria bacterium HGW-Atribacteria-1]
MRGEWKMEEWQDIKVEVLRKLVRLSNNLGREDYHFAIIGEGNTSAKIEIENIAKSFFIKASGTQLAKVSEKDFIQVYFEPIMQLINMENPDAEDINHIFEKAKVDKKCQANPSVETLLHAICLNLQGVNFVAHTHPIAVNKLTCSKSFPENLEGRVFPDEVVLLGKESIFVPYTDPGVKLAQKVKIEIELFLDKHGETPKSIYIQNHGFVALGSTPIEVENITLMAAKAAEIRFGALLAGGINTFSEDIVVHLAERADEKYRQRQFEKQILKE